MIPQFPDFKKLELRDKDEVEKFTKKFPPYSDFNFVSMWSWDINGTMGLSILNGNLVVLFDDYVSGNKFLSFLGTAKIPETVSALVEYSRKKLGSATLELIPEEIVEAIPLKAFVIEPDRSSFDYIYSVAHLSQMDTWSKNTSGKKIRKFLRHNGNRYSIKHMSLKDLPKNDYRTLFKKWADGKGIDNHFEYNEYRAFERFLNMEDVNLKIVSLYLEKTLVGFTAYEITSKDFVLSHFAKADINYDDAVTDILNWEEAKILKGKGVKYFNWEQDLGIPGLRYAKKKYKHIFFLKKFVVKPLEERYNRSHEDIQ